MSPVVGHFRLLLDILSVKAFVWMFGKNDELLDSHLFFFDKYSDLADYHRSRGRIGKANRLAAIAESHCQLAPDDDPTEAAAMAMPVLPVLRTEAVSACVVRPAQRFGPSGSPMVEVGVLVRSKTRRRPPPREAEPGPSAMALSDIAGGAFYHADLRVGEADGPNR